MAPRTITTVGERALLLRAIAEKKLPFSADIGVERKRTVEQNRLQRLLIKEIADQLGDRTPEEVRGYCKLTLGVPILRAENEAFREAYDRAVKRLPYEAKLAIMMEPLDMPVTRLMTVPQKTAYLEAIYRHFGEMGVALTVPTSEAA
jgi:hypothetical protein